MLLDENLMVVSGDLNTTVLVEAASFLLQIGNVEAACHIEVLRGSRERRVDLDGWLGDDTLFAADVSMGVAVNRTDAENALVLSRELLVAGLQVTALLGAVVEVDDRDTLITVLGDLLLEVEARVDGDVGSGVVIELSGGDGREHEELLHKL